MTKNAQFSVPEAKQLLNCFFFLKRGERDRQTVTENDRETDRQRQRETDRDRERERERERAVFVTSEVSVYKHCMNYDKNSNKVEVYTFLINNRVT